MSQYSLLYVPIDSKEEAISLAKKMLESKLIACANIIGSGTSIYQWQGEIKQDDEYYILFKTLRSKVSEARVLISELHSYDTPCVAEIAINSLNEEYAAWLSKCVES